MGTLYYGDNLDILRRTIADASVALIYLDPPFNSAQNTNAFFQEKDGTAAAAQIQAFSLRVKWNSRQTSGSLPNTTVAMTESEKYECNTDIERIRLLFGTGIFSPAQGANPLQDAAFIEVVICLRDLLAKCEKYAKRIDFADDIVISLRVKDVTAAVINIRDACCHIDSDKRHFADEGGAGTNVYSKSFGVTSGVVIAGNVRGSEYPDDAAFSYGANRVYLNRHILRAYEEAKQALGPFLR